MHLLTPGRPSDSRWQESFQLLPKGLHMCCRLASVQSGRLRNLTKIDLALADGQPDELDAAQVARSDAELLRQLQRAVAFLEWRRASFRHGIEAHQGGA